jgi:hypothetical protein
MEWSRAKRTSRPSIQPVYTYALVLISLAATLGIQGFRYMRVWTPLERHYLPAYLGSQMAGIVRDNGSYTLLQVVTRKGSRVALDSDVVPAMSDSGQNVFALTEEAVKHGGLRLEIHRADYNNAEMHAYLGNLIYRNQNLVDLVRLALWGGLVMFFAGVLPATYLDGKRSVAVRNGKKPRSLELIPVAQLNRTRSSRGLGFVNRLHTMLKRVLDINKKVHAPRNKDNPSASIVAEPLSQKPIRMPAAVGTDNPLRPSSTRREPTPSEQTPIQDQEFKPTVKPTPRRFFE